MDNRRYYIEFEVLTPLSVGAGNDNEWICGVDYVQQNQKIYVLDMEKAAKLGVDVQRLATAFANSNQEAVIRLIGNNLPKVAIRIFDAPASSTNPVKSFIRTKLIDKPVVPGSSIKGAIRSCLFNYLHGHKQEGEDTRDINDRVFGTMKIGDVFTRFIHVGDIVMRDTKLFNTKLFNLRRDREEWKGGWKHAGRYTTERFQRQGFNTLYECIEPGLKGIGTIDMMNNAYDLLSRQVRSQSYEQQKNDLMQGGIAALFRAINQATKSYLEKELNFFEHFSEGTENVDKVIEGIQDVIQKIPEDDSYCVMKMSAGAGFHNITGDWIYDDYIDEPGLWPDNDRRNAHKKKYKSRKIVQYGDKLQLMGFVVVRNVTEKGDSIYLEHIAQMKKSEKQLLAEIEEQKRRQAEEHEMQLKANADKRRMREKEYDEIMQEAKRLAEGRNWDEAISKAIEAGQLLPEHNDHVNSINLWEKQKKVDAERQIEAEKDSEKFMRPLADLLNPSSLGNIIGTTKKWLKYNGADAFGDSEMEVLVQAMKQLPDKELGQIGKKRKDLVKAIGEQWTQSLLEKLL